MRGHSHILLLRPKCTARSLISSTCSPSAYVSYEHIRVAEGFLLYILSHGETNTNLQTYSTAIEAKTAIQLLLLICRIAIVTMNVVQRWSPARVLREVK